MQMPTNTQKLTTNIVPYSPFKWHKNNRYFNQQLICSYFIFMIFFILAIFLRHKSEYEAFYHLFQRNVPVWKPLMIQCDDPINIPTFNKFAFTAKCFIPFLAYSPHSHLILVGRLSRDRRARKNMLTYTEFNFNYSELCIAARSTVVCLYICLSVCLSVSLYSYSIAMTESQSHRMVMCFFVAWTLCQSLQSIRMCRLCLVWNHITINSKNTEPHFVFINKFIFPRNIRNVAEAKSDFFLRYRQSNL